MQLRKHPIEETQFLTTSVQWILGKEESKLSVESMKIVFLRSSKPWKLRIEWDHMDIE